MVVDLIRTKLFRFEVTLQLPGVKKVMNRSFFKWYKNTQPGKRAGRPSVEDGEMFIL